MGWGGGRRVGWGGGRVSGVGWGRGRVKGCEARKQPTDDSQRDGFSLLTLQELHVGFSRNYCNSVSCINSCDDDNLTMMILMTAVVMIRMTVCIVVIMMQMIVTTMLVITKTYAPMTALLKHQVNTTVTIDLPVLDPGLAK